MEPIIAPPPIVTQELGIVLFGQAIFLLALAFIVIFLFTTVLWVSYLFHRNSSIIDIGWSCSFLLALIVAGGRGNGSPVNKFILSCMVFPWAIRLFIHLYHRFVHGQEDPRYVRLREKWGGDPNGMKFLLLFWGQGCLAAIIALPFYFIAVNPIPSINVWAFLSFLVWLFGFVGETVADWELSVFKSDEANRGKILDKGLWAYSRHPNYFFEWVIWIGFTMMAWNGAWSGFWGVIPLISPLLMLFLLLKVSGIPLLEDHLQGTQSDAYREYMRKTPPFFPSFSFWEKL